MLAGQDVPRPYTVMPITDFFFCHCAGNCGFFVTVFHVPTDTLYQFVLDPLAKVFEYVAKQEANLAHTVDLAPSLPYGTFLKFLRNSTLLPKLISVEVARSAFIYSRLVGVDCFRHSRNDNLFLLDFFEALGASIVGI